MCKLGYPVSRLFTRGSGEEDRNVRGEGKEQGSENQGGGGGGGECEQSLHVVMSPLVIIVPFTCQQG